MSALFFLTSPPPNPNIFQTVAKEHAPTSTEFFRLLSRMLNHAHQNGVSIQGMDTLLERELKWLLKVRVSRVFIAGICLFLLWI